MQDSLPAGGLRLYREGVEPSGSHRKVSGYISILLSRTSPDARIVYAKKPFGGPAQVLAYLGRYTHRVAIANSRLVALDNNHVAFSWKDYRQNGAAKVMKLKPDEFIRRFLLHTLPDGFHRIRSFGFMANGHRADKLTLCRSLLADRVEKIAPGSVDPSPVNSGRQNADFPVCPDCGGVMRIIARAAPGLDQSQPRSAPLSPRPPISVILQAASTITTKRNASSRRNGGPRSCCVSSLPLRRRIIAPGDCEQSP